MIADLHVDFELGKFHKKWKGSWLQAFLKNVPAAMSRACDKSRLIQGAAIMILLLGRRCFRFRFNGCFLCCFSCFGMFSDALV